MLRYMVVANETLLGMPLTEEVKRRIEESKGDCAIHVVVPASHGMGMWTEGAAKAKAARQLEHGEARFMQMGADTVTGTVGDPSPVLAVGDALIAATEPYDEVIVSTHALGRSRWLKQDVIHRLQRAHPKMKVTHVLDSASGAGASSSAQSAHRG